MKKKVDSLQEKVTPLQAESGV